jgi:hypothetical protein
MQPPIGASRQSVQLLRASGWGQSRLRCLTKTVTAMRHAGTRESTCGVTSVF